MTARRRVGSVVIARSNGPLIARFAQLCIRPDDVVLDATWGRGGFWKTYRHPGPFIAHDLYHLDGVHPARLPEDDRSVDVVIGDPPHGAQGGRTTSTIPDFLDRYGLDTDTTRTPGDVRDLYAACIKEWARVSRRWVAVKCSNLTTSGDKQWGHEDVIAIGRSLGLERWDEMLLVRPDPGPQPARARQVHTHNQHSFLCIFRVPTTRRTNP